MTCAGRNHRAALFFGLLIAAPLLLIAGLSGWQISLKHRWAERLEQEAVQTINVPLASIVWQEEGREFTVDGQFFDVISYRVYNGFISATGVFDNAETRLHAFVAGQLSQSPQTLSIIQLLLVIQGFAAFVKWNFQVTLPLLLRKLFCCFLVRFHNRFKTILTPPPRLHFYNRF